MGSLGIRHGRSNTQTLSLISTTASDLFGGPHAASTVLQLVPEREPLLEID